MGIIQRIIPKTPFDFGKPAASSPQVQEVVLVRALPVYMWTEMTLIFRVHGVLATWTSGTQISAKVYAEAPSDEDPMTDYLGDELAAATYTAAGLGTLPRVTFTPVEFTTGGYLPSHVRVVLKALQPSGTPGALQALQAYVSLDFSCKC